MNENLNTLLDYFGSRASKSLSENDLYLFKERLEEYREIIEYYLENRAIPRDRSLGSSVRRPSNRIIQNLINLYEVAISKPNTQFSLELIGSVRLLISRAYSERDRMMLEKFLSVYEDFVRLDLEKNDSEMSRALLLRLKKSADHILYDVENNLDTKDTLVALEFLALFYNSQKELIRKIIVSENKELFVKSLKMFDEHNSKLDRIKSDINFRDISDNSEPQKEDSDILDKIDDLNQELEETPFGVGAWVFREYENGNLDEDFFNNVREEVIGKFENKSIGEISSIYFEILESTPSYWNSWQMSEELDVFEGATSMGSPAAVSWIQNFYCGLMIRNISDDKIEEILEREEEFSNPISVRKSIKDNIESLKEQTQNFSTEESLMRDIEDIRSRKEAVSKIFENIKSEIETDERQEIINSEVSDSLVSEFKTGLRDSWESNADFRKLYNDLGRFEENSSEAPEEARELGLNRVFYRSYFVEDSPRNWVRNVDDNWGRAIAKKENEVIFEELFGSIEFQKISWEEIDSRMLDADISGFEDSQPIMLVGNSPRLKYRAKNIERLEINEEKGKYLYNNKEVPIYHINHLRDKLIITTAERLGRLLQYSEGENLSIEFSENIPSDVSKNLELEDPETRVLIKASESFEVKEIQQDSSTISYEIQE
ncbi:hypothetical protein ACK3SF_01800 [Candidatus Nanosalina sp. VS9-1]|uniref:hypothetical protein n=1 Tax=Candidatus Nanosalina sp. VS9-1 TaxID=3388566 RepID=UPI0039DFF620